MRQILSRCSLFRLDVKLVAKDDPDHDGARRMIHDKAVEANEEVRHLLPLCLIEPSKSPWGTGVVMLKKWKTCVSLATSVKLMTILSNSSESCLATKASHVETKQCDWPVWIRPQFLAKLLWKKTPYKNAFGLDLSSCSFEFNRMLFDLCNVAAWVWIGMDVTMASTEYRTVYMLRCHNDSDNFAIEKTNDQLKEPKEVFSCLTKLCQRWKHSPSLKEKLGVGSC